jgi:acetolactate synthase-1/2/3 large subunit
MAVVDALAACLPREAIVTMDMTIVCYSAIRMLPRYEPRTCFYPSYYGTLGFSPPAAMGASLARTGRPVVSLCGDGGFLFTGQELATAVLEKIPVTFVVFNDSGYSAIRRAERRTYGDRILGADLANPDFVRYAESFGVSAVCVNDPAGLTRALRQAIDADEARLIEMKIDPPLSEQ